MKIYQKGLGDGGAERFVYQRLQHSFESENEIAMDSSDKKALGELEGIGQNLFSDNIQSIMQVFFDNQKVNYQPLQKL